MALLYPRSLLYDTPSSERTVWMALRGLSDDWRVFHHLEWEGDSGTGRRDGEADFVLLHREVGILVLEVKGGGIAVGARKWYSFDRFGRRHEIDDPFEQAMTSKYALIDYLKEQVSDLPFLPAGHAVVLPDVRIPDALGANAPHDLIICKPDLADPSALVRRVADHWELRADLGVDLVAALTDALAPSREVRRTARDDLVEVSAQIEFWTNEQLEALEALRRNRRQLIYGSAGTGKTVLASEKARRLARDGRRVLLTCFNQPLARALADQHAGEEGVEVYTFHGLCRRLAGLADRQFPKAPDSEWWDQAAPDVLVECADAVGFHVDAIVVDEGQDFGVSWWAALELLLDEPDVGEFYVFSDTHQAIYRQRNWAPPFDGPVFELRKNCRNTVEIAERVAAVFGDEPASLGAVGIEPEFHPAVNQEGAVRLLRGVLHKLLNEGKLDYRQVAILCQRRRDVDDLRRLKIAGHAVTDMDHWGEGVLAEMIHRFKGLEAEVCIVILWDLSQAWGRSLAYIGMSWPRVQLHVVGPPKVRGALAWER